MDIESIPLLLLLTFVTTWLVLMLLYHFIVWADRVKSRWR